MNASFRLIKNKKSSIKRMLGLCFLAVILTGCPDSPVSGICDNGSCNGNLQDYQLNNGMQITVYTPPGYDQSKEYPLLILNDGETVFPPDPSSMAIIFNTLIEEDITEPFLAVAIYSGLSRNNWYIPYEDDWVTNNWGKYEPEAELYANQIFEQVIPSLQLEYNINEEEVGIMGYSLGGLVSTWMGLTYPDQIKYSASLSGSFWVADYAIFDEVDEAYDNGQKFWFDIGTKEWNYYVPLYAALEEAGVEPGIRSFYYEVPDGRHVQSDWLERIPYPLMLFFGTEEPEPERMEVILECIPSQSTSGLFFRRMNPIITLSNGVKYSLAHTATYTLQSGDVQLGVEGSFINNPDIISKVLVEYETFSETVSIPKGFCP
jgi:predicted alpha/beta superfamily hydrolase